MRTTLLLPFIVLGFAFGLQLAPAWAFTTDGQEDICATAAVIMCENFENETLGLASATLTRPKFKNNGWAVSDSSMTVTSETAFDGAKSMRWTYPANFTSGFIDNYFSQNYTNLYFRWYMKNSANWVWSANGNKMVFIGGQTQPHNLMYNQGVSGNTPAWRPQYGINADPFRFPNTGPGFSFPLDQWVCMETHIVMNSTTSASNGTFEGWINNTLRFNYPTQINFDRFDTFMRALSFSGYWNCASGSYTGGPGSCNPSDPRNNHPDMERWIDNIVVSTQRIGCLGAPIAGDTTPPASPVGLTIR